jgi:AraC-like DNA-binding protein
MQFRTWVLSRWPSPTGCCTSSWPWRTKSSATPRPAWPTPLQWLLTQRIRRAQELLETTNDNIDTIASATGMGTATTLRRHFNRTVGVPPDTYRRTFRSTRPQ